MEHAPDGGKAWREQLTPFLTQTLKHTVFNPCVEESKILTPEESRYFRRWKSEDLNRFRKTVRKLIEKDLNTLLNEIDYVICYWDQYVLNGGGTHGELTMAYFHNIPVYMVTPFPLDQISSWILGCTTEVFSNFEDLKSFLHQKYSG
ncbi:MAG: hypothetical protein D6748_09445 [Calditrichaeota bacterium]|nr:MAG: hypothetical protein D6748_09445 [Calditrichota bacterium]